MNACHGSLLTLACVLVGCATPAVQLSPFDVAGPPPRPVPAPVLPRLEPLVFIETGQKESQSAVTRAASQSLVRPRREYFRRGLLIYPYEEGRRYLVKTQKHRPTDIVFPEGERLIPGVGIDDWWDIKEIDGVEPGTRARIVLTPKDTGLKGAMAVITTGGAYYLEVESDDRPGVVSITWEKPHLDMPSPAVAVAEESFGGGYVLDVPTPPPVWLPVRVYHNRYQTFLQCHPSMTVSEMPVVYALDREGKRQLVNWFPRDDTIVVDRRGLAFELQGSGGPTDVVRVRYVGDQQAATTGVQP